MSLGPEIQKLLAQFGRFPLPQNQRTRETLLGGALQAAEALGVKLNVEEAAEAILGGQTINEGTDRFLVLLREKAREQQVSLEGKVLDP